MGPDDFARVIELATKPPRPPRRVASTACGVMVILAVAFWIYSISRNKALEWSVVGSYLFNGQILAGLRLTVVLTVAVTLIGFVSGTVLAIMRMSANVVLRSVSWSYIWLFRAVPLLVQLLFWFNIGYLLPTISIGIPFGPTFASGSSRELISATTAAVLGLALHETAYAAEIVRGGILSVDHGQTEAARSLALGPLRTQFAIVLPQAMRSIIPAAVNLLIGTLKSTAIVSVLAVSDLLYSAQLIYNSNYQIIPLLLVATSWYIAITSLLSVAQYYTERYFGRAGAR